MVGMSSTSSTWYDCPGPVAHGAPVRIVLDTTCYSSHRPRPLYRNVGFEKTRKCVFLSPDIVTASNVTVAKTCLTVISPPSLKRMRIYHFLKRIQAQCPHRGGADGKMSWRGRLNFTIERAYKITPFCWSLYDLFAIKMRSFLNRKIFNNIVKRF